MIAWRTWGSLAPLLVLSALLSFFVAAPLQFAWHLHSAWSALPLASAHFVHLTATHFLFNIGALCALTWAAAWTGRLSRWYGALLISALAVDVGLIVQCWPVLWYAGMSGALHGGFAWLALELAQRHRLGKWAGLLWLGGIVKVAVETQMPAGLLSAQGFPLALPVHSYGYIAGSAYASLFWLRTRWLRAT